jgi:hypothetical protein
MLTAMKNLLASIEKMTYADAVAQANKTGPEMVALGIHAPTADELWRVRNNSITNLRKKIAALEAA